jgi:hypothetical protein
MVGQWVYDVLGERKARQISCQRLPDHQDYCLQDMILSASRCLMFLSGVWCLVIGIFLPRFCLPNPTAPPNIRPNVGAVYH